MPNVHDRSSVWIALGTLVFSYFISEVTILLKRKRAGEGGLPRKGHGHFPTQPRLFHYRTEQKASCGWVSRYTLEILSEPAQLGAEWHLWLGLWFTVTCQQVPNVDLSVCYQRHCWKSHIQHLHKDLGRTQFCTHMAASP